MIDAISNYVLAGIIGAFAVWYVEVFLDIQNGWHMFFGAWILMFLRVVIDGVIEYRQMKKEEKEEDERNA